MGHLSLEEAKGCSTARNAFTAEMQSTHTPSSRSDLLDESNCRSHQSNPVSTKPGANLSAIALTANLYGHEPTELAKDSAERVAAVLAANSGLPPGGPVVGHWHFPVLEKVPLSWWG